jgi:hypothetical protein
MIVLFLSLNHLWVFQFAVELELIDKHLKRGDDVFVLADDFSLRSIISMPKFLLSVKQKEKYIFNKGMSLINFPKKNIFKLNKVIKNANLLPPEFRNLDNLRSFSLFGINFGLGVASNLISTMEDHFPNTLSYSKLIYNTLYSSVLIYQSLMDKISKINPDLLYVYVGRFAETRPIVEISKKFNIPFYCYSPQKYAHYNEKTDQIKMISGYKLVLNDFTQSLSVSKKNILQTWDSSDSKSIKKIFAKKWYFFQAGKEEIISQKNIYIQNQIKNFIPDNFNGDKKKIVIFNSSMDEYESIPEYNNQLYKNDNVAIKKIINSFESESNIQFFLRIHPHLSNRNNTQIQELKKLKSDNLYIIWPEEPIDTYALLNKADTVITFGSTIGIEACFWGKPSILLGRSVYEDLGCCYIPQTHEEVICLLKKNLSPLDPDGTIKYGYWMMKKGIPSKNSSCLRYETKQDFFNEILDYKKINPATDFNFINRCLWKIFCKIDNIRMN